MCQLERWLDLRFEKDARYVYRFFNKCDADEFVNQNGESKVNDSTTCVYAMTVDFVPPFPWGWKTKKSV